MSESTCQCFSDRASELAEQGVCLPRCMHRHYAVRVAKRDLYQECIVGTTTGNSFIHRRKSLARTHTSTNRAFRFVDIWFKTSLFYGYALVPDE